MTDERLAENEARLKARVEDESDWSDIAELLAEGEEAAGGATGRMRPGRVDLAQGQIRRGSRTAVHDRRG